MPDDISMSGQTREVSINDMKVICNLLRSVLVVRDRGTGRTISGFY